MSVRARLGAAWRAWRPSILVALVAVGVFRALTLLIALLAVHGTAGFGMVASHPYEALLQPWFHWDAPWWTRIAEHGYGYYSVGPESDGAFAPGYAMSIRALMFAFHLDALVAAFLVSGLSLVVAVAVVHHLATEDHGRWPALVTVLLMLVWPTAVFFAAPYSEPLSLALVALALLAARREHWLWAGLLAAAAMLSKYVLGLLVLALLVDHVVRQRRRGQGPQPRALAAIAVPGALALAGVLLFMRARFGSPLFFLDAEARAWGHRLSNPVRLALNSRRELAAAWQLGAESQFRGFLLDDFTIAGLVALAGFALFRARRRVAETALVALLAATFVCMSGPDSVSRYALVIAPMFLLLGPAIARRPSLRTVVLVVGAMLMVLDVYTYASNGWAG